MLWLSFTVLGIASRKDISHTLDCQILSRV